MARLHVGTSGFVYRHWRGVFYPEDVPAKAWLRFYADVFSTVELNTTFYQLPSAASVDRWRAGTPDGFVFAAKGSRFITHMKLLLRPKEALKRYFDVVQRLGPKLGPVLWQLPPRLVKPDLERLDAFIDLLPRHLRHAFEFRSDGWYTDEVCELLDHHGCAFCEHDNVKRPAPRHTGGFRYVRFHGSSAMYQGRYGKAALRPWAEDLRRWRASGRDAYVYFNNDLGGHAVMDALDLSEQLGAELPIDLSVQP